MVKGSETFEPRKILEVLESHGVQCVILGGIASRLHGAPFLTTDVDLCPALDLANLERLSKALSELDAHARVADEADAIKLELNGKYLKKLLVDFRFVHFKTKYGFLDLHYRPAGTEGYRDLAKGAVIEKLGPLEVQVASLEDVIRSKQAAGRERDLQQLPTLRRLLEIRRSQSEDDGSSNV